MQFSKFHSAAAVGRPDASGIPVVNMGGGYLKAILLDGRTVFGRDWWELVGRLKLLPPGVVGVPPQLIEQALEKGKKRDAKKR
jgi:hypothetical protein